MSPPGSTQARLSPIRSRLRSLPLAVGLAAASLLPASASAQDATTGAIHGTTLDTTGAVVSRARVVLHDLATGQDRRFLTAQDGSFFAPTLSPGTYTAEIQAPGFAVSRAFGILVALGSTTEIAPVLQTQSASTSITVTADPEPAAPGSVASIISGTELTSLPLDGRRWQSFAILTPQANPAGESFDLLSFRGLPTTQNSTQLDGVDNDQGYSSAPRGAGRDSGPEAEDESDDTGNARDASRGYASGEGAGRHPGMAYTFSEAAVREFRVTGQNDSALYGHAAGGVITTVSRSGTGSFHGGLFYLVRTNAFAASDPSAVATHYHDGLVTSQVVKPHDLRQQFGGTLGGPLRARRLFFFVAADAQRRGFPAASTPENPSFYSLTAVQAAVLGTRGVSTSQTQAALNYLDSLTGTAARRQDQLVLFGKLDAEPRQHDRLSLEENHAHLASPGGGRTTTTVNRGLASFGNTQVSVDSAIARWVHLFGAGLSNEFRAQYSRDLHLELPQTPLPQEPAVATGGFAPEIAIGPQGLIFGTPASLGQGPSPEERRSQAAEILTWAHAHHLLQLGGDFSYLQDHVETLANALGTFRYDSGFTAGKAGGLVDWITDFTFNVHGIPNGGCPSINAPDHLFCFRSFSQSFGPQDTRFSTQEWAAFLQEDWRLHPRLSISAGLRYEYEFLPLPQHPNGTLDAAFGSVGATGRFPEDRNNFGPRLGLSWQPLRSSATVLRAGYGLFFGRLPGATVRAALTDTALPSSTARIRIVPSAETACPQVPDQGFGYPCTFLDAPPAGVASTTSALVFDRRFRLPTSQQATLSLEHTLSRGIALQAGYALSLTHQLPNTTDLNIAPSVATRTFQLQGAPPGPGRPGLEDGDQFSLPLYTQRIDTLFGVVTDLLSNANASYNALILEARQRTHGSLEWRASWTWSKAIDFGGDRGAVPPTNGQLDPFNIRYDKGLSDLNYPHKLVASAIWRPQLAPSRRRWVLAFGQGWSVAPILVESSGRPYTYNLFGGSRLSGGHESLNGAGGALYLPTVGRNTLHLPEQLDLNLRLAREIATSDHTRLRLSADVFNLPNHRNITAVTERAYLVGTPVNGITPLIFQDAAAIATEGLNAQPFGSVTGAGQGAARQRQVQLGCRLEF